MQVPSWQLVALAGASIALAGCGRSSSGPAPEVEPSREDAALRSLPPGSAAQLVPLAPEKIALCRKAPLLRPACPTRAPKVRAAYLSRLSRSPQGPSVQPILFDLERGGEDPRRPYRNRPPFMAHVTVEAGALERGDPFEHPLEGVTVRLRAGLLDRKRTKAVFFGRYEWGGRRGVVFLAPPFLYGGQLGNHLTFRWRYSGTAYLVSLHAWEPLPDAAHTLRAIVLSTPDPR